MLEDLLAQSIQRAVKCSETTAIVRKYLSLPVGSRYLSSFVSGARADELNTQVVWKMNQVAGLSEPFWKLLSYYDLGVYT